MIARLESHGVTPTLGDDYLEGYAAGVADARVGMAAYVAVELAGEEYARGYETGVKEVGRNA